MTKYRIRRANEYNWVIEDYTEAGKLIERGKFAGQLTKGGWNEQTPLGYFPTVKHAASRLLDHIVGDEWPKDGWTGENLQTAIDKATERVIAVVKEINLDIPAKSSSANPAAGFTEEQKEIVRNSNKPAEAYVIITKGKRFKRTGDETARKLTPDQAALERVNACLAD
jgi:hypothetical protein